MLNEVAETTVAPPPLPPPDSAGPPTLLDRRASARARVLMRGDVLWEPAAGPPDRAAELMQAWEVDGALEPAARTVTVGPEWVDLLAKVAPLTEDWPGPPSLVYVENLTGLGHQVRPTPTELAAEAARVVELTADPRQVPFQLVRPQRGWPFEPAGRVYARCPTGTVKLRLVALPPAYAPNGPPTSVRVGFEPPEPAVLRSGGVVGGGGAVVTEYGSPPAPAAGEGGVGAYVRAHGYREA